MIDLILRKIRNRRIAWREGAERRSALRLARTYALPEVTLAELGSDTARVLPPVMDDICLPPYVQGRSDLHDDYAPLMAIAAARQPKVIVELGTAHGNTVANLCKHCPNAHVLTVNAPAAEMTGAVTTFALSREEIGSVYRRLGLAERVEQIYCNTLSLDLAPHLNNRTIDLAIIDACHDTPFVLNDFQKVRPFIAKDGIVLFHDTHPSMQGHLIGSYAACMMLRRDGFDVRHLKGTWWGVLKV